MNINFILRIFFYWWCILEIKVQNKNKKYAELLKENYSGKFSDLVTFLFFKYQNYLFSNVDNFFSNNMGKISNDSLSHLEIFGRIISLLGDTPDFNNFEYNKVYYINEKEKLIEIDIRIIKEKIIKYTKNMNLINDEYIKEILKNFIIEERKNLEILEMIQLKYKKEHF